MQDLINVLLRWKEPPRRWNVLHVDGGVGRSQKQSMSIYLGSHSFFIICKFYRKGKTVNKFRSLANDSHAVVFSI